MGTTRATSAGVSESARESPHATDGKSPLAQPPVIVTLVSRLEQVGNVSLLIASVRSFGGTYGQAPFWVFSPLSNELAPIAGRDTSVRIIALDCHELPDLPFALKVQACARAEELADGWAGSLIWLDPGCLVLQPPAQLDLRGSSAAAFRPVHIRNIGSPAGEEIDSFWRRVYQACGVEEASTVVESFVDELVLRPYYNTHVFSLDPSWGILREWKRRVRTLAADAGFQQGLLRDELHRIFLHQAVLSTLVMKRVAPDRLRLLPPTYSYPLHLHPQVPDGQRAHLLDERVCPVYEGRYRHPDTHSGLRTTAQLYAWLGAQS